MCQRLLSPDDSELHALRHQLLYTPLTRSAFPGSDCNFWKSRPTHTLRLHPIAVLGNFPFEGEKPPVFELAPGIVVHRKLMFLNYYLLLKKKSIFLLTTFSIQWNQYRNQITSTFTSVIRKIKCRKVVNFLLDPFDFLLSLYFDKHP